MKAITLTQPWATLIALGAKRVETRGPRFPRLERGTEIAIHAASGLNGLKDDPDERVTAAVLADRLRRLCATEPFSSALAPVARAACTQTLVPSVDWCDRKVLPRGVVVAVARVAGVERAGQVRDQIAAGRVTGYGTVGQYERVFGGYEPDRQAIFLEHVTALLEPVPATGQLGLWDLDPAAAGQVRHALHLAYEHAQAPYGDPEPLELPPAVGSFRTHTPPFAAAAAGERDRRAASGGQA